MNLVKRVFLRKSVLSILLTAVVIALLVFAGPHAAQAITITVSNPASGTLGSSYNFTVTVNIQDTDLLPVESVDLQIINTANTTYTRTVNGLPLMTTASPVSYPHADGNVSVSATSAAGWGEAQDTRWGYGYKYPSGPTDNYSLGTGYGYGYTDGGHQGTTSMTYNVTWTTPSGWPEGNYKIIVIVHGNGSTEFTHQDLYIFTLSTGGGGGGGGGGGVPAGVTFFVESRNPLGEFLNDVIAQSWDKQVTLTISKGTIGKNSQGAPLSWVSIMPMEDYPDPPEDVLVIGIPYDFGPDWATFDPPVRITYRYNPASLPEGVDEEKLSLAYYNSVRKEWIILENITIDTVAHTISGDASHFTCFAILYVPGLVEEPEPTTTPPTTPPTTTPTTTPPTTMPPTTTPPPPTTPPPTEPTTDTGVIVVPPIIAPIDISDSGGINQWALAGMVFGGAILIIGLAVYLFWYRKILE